MDLYTMGHTGTLWLAVALPRKGRNPAVRAKWRLDSRVQTIGVTQGVHGQSTVNMKMDIFHNGAGNFQF